MSEVKETQTENTEELNKSIDMLIDDLFAEEQDDVSKASPIDIAGDSKTTADAVVNQAPKFQDDATRGAGRPQQISDVPKIDQDGQRAKQYDAAITENENKEDEPEETKQSPSMDQTQDKKRIAQSPKAPASRPFMKSENGEETEIDQEEWEQFQAFKKSQEEAKKAEELKKAEDLKKAEEQKQQDLIKSAVAEAVSGIRSENEELKKSLAEQSELLKAMANRPQRSKSITGIDQLEKSVDPENVEPQSFSLDEMKDAAFNLAIDKQIPQEAVSELEMTKSIADPLVRRKVEDYLHKSQK